jgi:acyl carrier protein
VAVREERLVAYLVGKEGKAPESGELRRFLRERLPEYLVPGRMVEVGVLPRTPSGKIDRGALATVSENREPRTENRLSPRTEMARVVAGVWEEVLGVERIGVGESFFELGGHSLLATQAVTRVRERLGVEVELRTLFEHPTVAEFALAVEEARARGARPSAPAIVPLARERYRVTREALAAPGGPLGREPSAIRRQPSGKGGDCEPLADG